MTFQSAKSNVQVIEEVVVRKTVMDVNNIPVFDIDGKMIDSGISATGLAGYFSGYDIIVPNAQSNGEGRGKPYNEYMFAQDPDVFMLGQWNDAGNKLFFKDMVVTAREPCQPSPNYFGNYNTNSNDVAVSHALSFAKEYKKRGYLKPGRKILIAGYCLGGTSFSTGFWQYPAGDGYLRMMRQVKIALNLVGQNGLPLDNRIVAYLRHQGEGDAGNASFQAQQDAFILGTHSELSSYYAGVIPPFILGGMGDKYKLDTPALVTIDNILKDTPNRIAKTAYYQANGLKSNNDIFGDSDNHFNAYAQFEIGVLRAMDAYENALNNTNTAAGKVPNRVYGIACITPSTDTIRTTWELVPTFGTGSAVTAHTLRWRIAGTPAWTTVLLGAGILTYDLTGLTTGVEYDIQVRAENAIGAGLYSKSIRTIAITISGVIPQSASIKYIMPLTADASDSSGNGFNGTLLGSPTFGTVAGMGASCLILSANNQGLKNTASNAAIFSKAGIFKPNFASSGNTRMALMVGTNTTYFKLDFQKVSSIWSMRIGVVNGTPINWPSQVITNVVDGTVFRLVISLDNARGSEALKIMVNGIIYNFNSANVLSTDTAQYYGAIADVSGGDTFIGAYKAIHQWNGSALSDTEMLNMDLVLQSVL